MLSLQIVNKQLSLFKNVNNQLSPFKNVNKQLSIFFKNVNKQLTWATCRTLAQREKLEKETRRFCGRKLSYMQLTDKYGLSAAVARKRAGLPPLHNLSIKSSQEGAGAGQVSLAPSGAKSIEDIEILPMDQLFNETIDLTKITTLEQRLVQLDVQPVPTKGTWSMSSLHNAM